MQTLVNPTAIPSSMRTLPRWVGWRYESVNGNGKKTKVPYQINGKLAKTNDPSTWSSFEAVLGANHSDGPGFVLFKDDPFAAVDLDHCISSGQTADWAIKIIQLFPDAYIEKSPSGEGLHIICQGKPIRTGSKKWLEDGIKVGVEVYDGSSPRYFTMTGDVVQVGDTIDCQGALDALHDMYFADDETLSKPCPEQYINYKPASIAEIQSALSAVSADCGYDEWKDIGMALKSAQLPVAMWDAWSSKSSKYTPGLCEKKWTSFKGTGISIGTLFHYAHQAGWINPIVSLPPGLHKLERAPEPAPTVLKIKPEVKEPGSVLVEVEEFISGNPVEHKRWLGHYIPSGYRLTEGGLYKVDRTGMKCELICSPICAIASTSIDKASGHGLIIEYITRFGDVVKFATDCGRAFEDAKSLASELTSKGLQLMGGKEKDLLHYFTKLNPPKRLKACIQTGWQKTDDDNLVFIFPEESTDENYHFQPDRIRDSDSNPIKTRGTLQDWIENVFDTNPYPLFAVFCALSAPLLRPAGLDPISFNLHGTSSIGKTALLQLIASVFGNGSDPSSNNGTPYAQKLNTTGNAMESTAELYNDLPLAYDEIGSMIDKGWDTFTYIITGGVGKVSLRQNRDRRAPRRFTNTTIFTGEISSKFKIESAMQGKKGGVKAGQMIRILDLALSDGMFKDAATVDRLKRNCGKYYGNLGREYIYAIAEKYTWSSLGTLVINNLDIACARIAKGRGKLNSLQERANKRFGICEVAGHLCVSLNIIPNLTHQMVNDCIDKVVDAWMPYSHALSDSNRSTVLLRDFILKNRDLRFKNIKLGSFTEDKLNREIAGYYDSDLELFYLLPEAFKEATGSEAKATAKELKEAGYLKIEKKDRLTYRITVDKQAILTYCVKASLLGESTDE